jgi:uncharacterized protein YndB with AHSA1/START domain
LFTNAWKKNFAEIQNSSILKTIMNDAMAKSKFTFEYEINASKKMLYPYFTTASGLAQWFADDVTVDEDHTFNFIWEDEDHKAKMVSHRTNSYAKFVFLSSDGEEDDAPNSLEFRLEENEMTQTTFIKVADYSDFDDKEEQAELWTNLFHGLREIVGG